MQSRLAISYANEGVTCIYSGSKKTALLQTLTLLEIKQNIKAVWGRYNFCLINRYRSGADSVGDEHLA